MAARRALKGIAPAAEMELSGEAPRRRAPNKRLSEDSEAPQEYRWRDREGMAEKRN